MKFLFLCLAHCETVLIHQWRMCSCAFVFVYIHVIKVDPLVPQPPGSSRFTRSELNTVARALFARAGLKEPSHFDDSDQYLGSSSSSISSSISSSGGNVRAPEERRLLPRDATTRNLEARPLPPWLVAPLWGGMVGGRAGLVYGLGLHSATVNLGCHLGHMHYFDSHPGGVKGTRGAALRQDAPPLLLCHGMFTNGLSMGLLAAALSDLGCPGGGERRVRTVGCIVLRWRIMAGISA